MEAKGVKVFAIECFEDKVERQELNVAAGSSLMQVLETLVTLAFEPLCRRLELNTLDELIAGDIGINGKRARLDQIILNNDRIEFYRPVLIDNKQARQLRVLAERRKKAQLRSLPKNAQDKSIKVL
jgi:putative ubiquitin-RnfH superfamily antitoxin RatB of RatAB toxin-antitoxin module